MVVPVRHASHTRVMKELIKATGPWQLLRVFEAYGHPPIRYGWQTAIETINRIALAAARSPGRSFQVLHVTGPRYHAEIEQALTPVPEGVVLVDYEDRMADAYAMADLVLCRAGSSTLAELTAIGKPSVLVPSPNVTDNHQEGNARGLEEVGAAVVMVEKDLSVDNAVAQIGSLMADAATLGRMAVSAREQGHLDTAQQVASLLGEQFLNHQ